MAENPIAELSDEELVTRARAGDTAAYGHLWTRHAHAGRTVARHFTTSSDADDLVVEAFTHILEAIHNGHGPTIAFRPYLYATIRNQARRWGRLDHEIPTDLMDALDALPAGEDPMEQVDNADMTVRAFRTLPARWQAILWYTQVERMEPHEVAPLLGISANSAASLAFRARDGLRSAWVQMHIADVTAMPDCNWARRRLGEYSRNRLTKREANRLRRHLGACKGCEEVASEAKDVAARLALVLVPLLLGATVGSSLIAKGAGVAAVSAAAGTTPLVTGTGSLVGATTAVSTATWATPMIVVGIATLAAVGAFVAPAASPPLAAPSSVPSAVQAGTQADTEEVSGVTTDGSAPKNGASAPSEASADSIAPFPPTVDSPQEGALVASSSPNVSGQGEPGATVQVRLGTADVARASVDGSGRWSITVPKPFQDGPAALSVTQRDSAGNESTSSLRSFTIDTVALPPSIQLHVTEDGLFAPAIDGLGEPDSTLLLVDENGTALCSTSVDQAGAWACGELASLGPGDHSVSATQVDPAGNTSPASAPTPFSIAPIDIVLAGSGCSSTTPCNIRVTGKPGALVRVLVDGTAPVFNDHPHGTETDSVQLNAGGQALLHLSLSTGQHQVTVFYISASSGRQGQERSIDVVTQ